VQLKLRTPIPDGQRSTLGISPLAMSTACLSKPRAPRCRSPIKCHLDSTHFQGPTRPRHLTLVWEIAGSRFPDANPLHWETPNAETPILRIRATCPSDNRRLPLNREIATRDFDVHATLALANPDMPICDGKWVLPALEVNPLATSPRSNGLRDFAILHRISSRRFSSS
jgi:hypothetical protein